MRSIIAVVSFSIALAALVLFFPSFVKDIWNFSTNSDYQGYGRSSNVYTQHLGRVVILYLIILPPSVFAGWIDFLIYRDRDFKAVFYFLVIPTVAAVFSIAWHCQAENAQEVAANYSWVPSLGLFAWLALGYFMGIHKRFLKNSR